MFVKDSLRAYPILGTSEKMAFRVLEFPGAINDPLDVPAMLPYLVPTWGQMESLAFILAKEIKRRNISVDAVVGAANGGLPYATLLRDRLDEGGKILTVGVTGYDDKNQPLEHRRVLYTIPDEVKLKNKVVVVADDINDKGKTEVTIKQSIASRSPKQMIGVSFFQRPTTENPSEIYGCLVEDEQEPWIVFPHDLYDSIKKIGGIWLGQGVSREVIARRFKIMFEAEKPEKIYLLPQVEDAMNRYFPAA